MPPRSARKSTSGASSGPKRQVRRTPKKSQNSEGPAAEEVSVEEKEIKAEEQQQVTPEVKDVVDIEEVVEVKVEEKNKMAVQLMEPEFEAEASGRAFSVDVEGDEKANFDEEDKGERLELDYNDAEYEHEEDQGVDYDGKDVVNDDGQEEGVEYEDVEEVAEGDEEMIDEIEDDGGDVEGEENDDNAEEQEIDGDEEEHHNVVHERRKRKEFEVFVGGLDKDATEADLRKVFGEVGEITEVRLMMNPTTKKNKGFAFLRFATVEQAKRAVSELKNPVVNGKQCGVSPSQDSDTLFLGNINKSWTKDELKSRLKHYGIDNVDDITLVEDTNNKGMNRGFTFLEFSSRSDAMDAYRRLQRRDIVFGLDRSAKVAFADTFIEPDDEIMVQVRTVFVDGLSATWDEDQVKSYLKTFGEIEKIELAKNMPSAKRKDFGFVTFDTHDAAVACAEGINNAELGEGDKKVKVRARLSRPHQRGRGKGAWGDHRIGRGAPFGGRPSWASRPDPHRVPSRASRGIAVRSSSIGGHGLKRSVVYRDRYPVMASEERVRPLHPSERSYARRFPVPSYPKSSARYDYSRRNEILSRNKTTVEYEPRVSSERRPSYRDDEYVSRGSAYSEFAPRVVSRAALRRGYTDEAYSRRFERPPPQAYRDSRAHDYDPLPGMKRSYSAVDDSSPRYSDLNARQSRARVDYGIRGISKYTDSYDERPGRSHIGYGSGRNVLSGPESHEYYGVGREGMDYGSARGDVGGVYPSTYGSGYMSRRSDVGSSSYSSMYSGRGLSGSGYMSGGGSGSYY